MQIEFPVVRDHIVHLAEFLYIFQRVMLVCKAHPELLQSTESVSLIHIANLTNNCTSKARRFLYSSTLCRQKEHTWTHLTVNIGVIFSGFPVLKELHVTIPHTFSYRTPWALVVPTIFTLYKIILFFTNNFHKRNANADILILGY